MCSDSVQAAIVGAGFSGLGAAIALQDAGIRDVVVLEKADRVGGTWRENTYPGCACDVPSALYSFSFAPNPSWSSVYAGQSEIQAYAERVARERELVGLIRFGTEVEEAVWNDELAVWEIRTSTGDLRARALIAAAGPLHEPAVPAVAGLEDFLGPVFHSSQWRHDIDLTGQRVAVIGTGASAIQFVPQIQPRVAHVTVFQRTAPWVLPKADLSIPPALRRLFSRLPAAQRAWRAALYHAFEAVQLAQRRPRLMQKLQRVGTKHVERSVPDPELRRLLVPNFTLGCKRILLSNDWYRALGADNATVIASGVREIDGDTVIAADGNRAQADVIILGTGFRATDPPIAHRVRGRDGRLLAEHWQDGMQAYLGTSVAGFPNFFTLIGPNLGNGHTSAFVIIEAQARYVAQAVTALAEHRALEVRGDEQDRWNEQVQRALKGTVWNDGGCSSYYLDASGRNPSIYPWTTIDLRRRLRRFAPAPYVVSESRDLISATSA